MQDRRDIDDQVGTNPDEVRGAHEPQVRPDDDEPSLRHPFRAFFSRHRTLDLTYRVAVGVLGSVIVLGGLALIPLPGPGWLIVFAGLALLATEFAWAGRLLDFARTKVLGWTHWVGRQSLAVRAAIGLAGLLVVVLAVWLYQVVVGFPGWVPVLG